MDLRRDEIERKDFPSARRGYDPAAVDRHLHAIADAVEGLAAATAQPSVAGVAAQRVEAIVAAAEASAREIEQRAHADAAGEVERARDVVDLLIEQANELQLHMTDVADAIAGLKAAVEAMRAEMAEPAPEPEPAPAAEFAPAPEPAPVPDPEPEPEPEPEPVALQAVPDPPPATAKGTQAPEGARLIALNMALSGTPREETARYLRENYDLEDSEALLDDVYAKAGG